LALPRLATSSDNTGMKRFVTIVLGLVLAVASASAQAPAPGAGRPGAPVSEEALDAVRQEMRTDRRGLVARSLDLADREGQAFWPLYEAYRKEMHELDDRQAALARRYVEAYDRLADRDAQFMIEDLMQVRRMRASVYDKYFVQFRRVLPPRQLARLMQIEQRLDTIVAYDSARVIPLVPRAR
jgi:Spy/CpxP family protein refolding chaperone